MNRAKAAGASVPQGAGVGPAEISLSSLLPAPALGSPTVTGAFSIFDDRYGASSYVRRPINLGDVALDRVPGRSRLSALFPENDNFSQFFEREIHDPSIVMTPSGRRGSVAAEMDRNGDLAFINQRSQDADVYAFQFTD